MSRRIRCGDQSTGRTWIWVLTFLAPLFAANRIASGGEITIYRDEFGTPHIYAATAEDACFGMGYAQAEDRLEEVLRQYRRATGTMSEVFGPGNQNLQNDYRQHLWQHAAISQAKYGQMSAKVRGTIEAYQDGIKLYMKEHPDKVPAWAPKLEPWMCIALGRYIIWGWPEGDAGGDMKRAGIEPDPIAYRGSNEWLLAPSRTHDKAPIALIDPHLGWYGAFRFYEARMYGGEIEFSGMAIAGQPLPALGHSRYCSIAMTTGGPDAADCYEEEINPANHRQYKRDGKWRDMVVRPVVIRVKEGTKVAEKRFEIEYTEHGKDDGSGEILCPVVARRGNKAYTLKLTYFDQVGLHEQTYRMCTAKNLAEMKQALGLLQLMEQNVMIGTVQGDIFYVRNGRVPIRAPGYDYKRPVPGNTSMTDWRGIHKFADLLQVENPPTGYMQNCNVSPQFLAKTRLIDPAAWKDRPYLFNGFWGLKAAYDNPLHQRAAMCVELLDKTHDATTQQAIAIATSPDVYGADVWQAMLAKAWDSSANKLKTDKNASGLYQVIQQWNRRCDADGVGAIAYHYWKEHFSSAVKLNDKAGFPPPKSVTDEMLLANLKRGADKLIADYGKLDVRFGDVYRVGRIGTQRDWPVSGGSIEGIATPRAISFDPIEKVKPPRFLGRGGQTSTQVVLLTKPPKSWTYLPLGESDHAESPHYDDQARELFSKSRMKSTYFLDKTELLKHVTSTKVIKRK